ncbi:hypothetical protein [Belnapia rosea]|uniref:hypothetical protein n=1 Tax=Belnapia rosea TaxID=938405 RepID=UPI00115F9255|nr:hypothetical protein [Belnapia rosea]
MQVWLFVQELMARNGWSANRACLSCDLTWIVGGRGGSKLDYKIRGQTLRSLYQRANRVLKIEREGQEEFLRALQRVGGTSLRAADPLPIAAAWNAELQRRLALDS